MKSTLIAVMILAVLPGAAVAAAATDAVLAEVQTALDNGDARQAKVLADAALGETGLAAAARGRLLLYRGLAEELLNTDTAAAADFTAALAVPALPPAERAQALLQRGFLRDGQGHLDQATADYTAVIELKAGGVATALNNRANIRRRQNRLTEARRDYLAALEQGRSQYAYYGLGQIAETQHDTLAARGFYARAVAADPGYALATQRLAALGGPPDGAIAQTAPVVLKPPPIQLRPPPETHAKTDLYPPAPGRVVLHPPAPARVGLHSPAADRVVLRPPRRAAPSRPASAKRDARLDLRPALDTPRGPEVQLGAWRSEAEARAGWAHARSKAGSALEGLAPHIVIADLPGRGRYYRLRTSPAGNVTAFCARLMASGLNCFPVRN